MRNDRYFKNKVWLIISVIRYRWSWRTKVGILKFSLNSRNRNANLELSLNDLKLNKLKVVITTQIRQFWGEIKVENHKWKRKRSEKRSKNREIWGWLVSSVDLSVAGSIPTWAAVSSTLFKKKKGKRKKNREIKGKKKMIVRKRQSKHSPCLTHDSDNPFWPVCSWMGKQLI